MGVRDVLLTDCWRGVTPRMSSGIPEKLTCKELRSDQVDHPDLINPKILVL
jgi:hypothetical protein